MAFAKLALGLAFAIIGQASEEGALQKDDECNSEECAISELQRHAKSLSAAKGNLNSSQWSMGPPATPFSYNGIEWPTIRVGKSGVAHFFAIGDWGGMDGALHPVNECIPQHPTPGCRPRIIAYSGGQTPGPHVFPRTRWLRQKANRKLFPKLGFE